MIQLSCLIVCLFAPLWSENFELSLMETLNEMWIYGKPTEISLIVVVFVVAVIGIVGMIRS